MWKEKSAGLKILWLWTFGTAAILVTNVVRTRVKDMQNYIDAQDEAPQPVIDDSNLLSDEFDSTNVTKQDD